MEIRNFNQTNQDPQRPQGTCEVGGRPAHCLLDRSDPEGVRITVRFSMEPRSPLPPFGQDRTELAIAGQAVPVRMVELPDGSEALRGRIDPALAEALRGPPNPPDTLDDPPTPERPENPDPAEDDDHLVALSRQHAAAKRERKQHADRVEALRSEAEDLRTRLTAADRELAAADEADAAHAERCAELCQRIRDALEAEEAG